VDCSQPFSLTLQRCKKMESRFKTTSGRIAFFAVMVALTTVANLIMVPMPQPLAEYDLSPVLIYTLGALVNPVMAAGIIATGMMIGTWYKVITFGFPMVFVLGAMVVRGIEAALISYIIRLKDPSETKSVTSYEVLAMVIGVIFETLGFFIFDWYLFGWAVALTVLPTIVDAVFIPIAIGVVAAIRRSLNINRLF